MSRLEDIAAEAVEIAEAARSGKIEKTKKTDRAIMFNTACATRDITQMSITVTSVLNAIALREKVDKINT
jgi:hypothetical protein